MQVEGAPRTVGEMSLVLSCRTAVVSDGKVSVGSDVCPRASTVREPALCQFVLTPFSLSQPPVPLTSPKAVRTKSNVSFIATGYRV